MLLNLWKKFFLIFNYFTVFDI